MARLTTHRGTAMVDEKEERETASKVFSFVKSLLIQ